jgi:hypothetical protein
VYTTKASTEINLFDGPSNAKRIIAAEGDVWGLAWAYDKTNKYE